MILGQCTSDRKQCTMAILKQWMEARNACSECRICVLYQTVLEWYPTRRGVVTYVALSGFAYDLANITWDNNNRCSVFSRGQTNQLGNVANALSGDISIVVMVALLYFDGTSMNSKGVKLEQLIWQTNVYFTLTYASCTYAHIHLHGIKGVCNKIRVMAKL